MKKYLIQRHTHRSSNARFLTTFDNFRYKSELQRGEDFAVFADYNKAQKVAQELLEKARKHADGIKKSLGKKADGIVIHSGYYYCIRQAN